MIISLPCFTASLAPALTKAHQTLQIAMSLTRSPGRVTVTRSKLAISYSQYDHIIAVLYREPCTRPHQSSPNPSDRNVSDEVPRQGYRHTLEAGHFVLSV